MKKLLSLLMVLTCFVSISFARSITTTPAISIPSFYKTTSLNTGATSILNVKFLVQDPHVYIFPTTCGWGSVTTSTELNGSQWVAIWSAFELLCHMPD